MSETLLAALAAYRDAVRALPKTFPSHADENGFRLDHVEGMKAALAVQREKIEVRIKALEDAGKQRTFVGDQLLAELKGFL